MRAVMSIGIVLGLGAVGTLAAWSDSATATSSKFSAGAILLHVNSKHETSTMTSLAMVAMKPGDSVAGLLPVENRGTVDFRYTATVTTTADSVLAPNLRVAAYRSATVINSVLAAGKVCNGTLINPAVALAPAPTSRNLISTARSLTVGASENICIQVTLDSSTVKPVAQGKSATVDFRFTANNP
ncbi:TasA family protein [Rhodococcus sp. H29-C3]|uniref:TasA family protein n=1 Tax=Rhodococcus sp. H29-C3 TaxID=3046307 RepID=UPI0024B93F31|nr:TasA family protein [Rhodococcus sp. H29-C3]MDJ0359119.1 TasA family protein [Rhodococcus sp. H29-C3]